jgi:hypothetical protein
MCPWNHFGSKQVVKYHRRTGHQQQAALMFVLPSGRCWEGGSEWLVALPVNPKPPLILPASWHRSSSILARVQPCDLSWVLLLMGTFSYSRSGTTLQIPASSRHICFIISHQEQKVHWFPTYKSNRKLIHTAKYWRVYVRMLAFDTLWKDRGVCPQVF